MNFLDLMRAEFMLVYRETIRRKAALVSMIMWPYLFAGLVLFIGFAGGSQQAFISRIGVEPVLFMVTSGYMMMAVLTCVDDILWRPLIDYWIGTLIYIIAAPVDKLALFLAIPIPRLTALLVMGVTSVLPIHIYYYGLNGFLTTSIVIALTAVGGLTTSVLATALTGIVHVVGESWRILGIIRPLLMILIGAFYPRFLMPLGAQMLSYIIPASHTVEAVQRILMGVTNNVYIYVVAAIVITALYTPVGRKSIAYWEKRKVIEDVKTD